VRSSAASLLLVSDGGTLTAMPTARTPLEERWPRPAVMGVLNITPDSFSDGGRFLAPAGAIEHGRRLVEEGAAIVDIGGESTRPGAEPVSAAEELARVESVLEGLRGLPVSIDTSKAAVAKRALELGAEMVNDVTALRADEELAGVVAEDGAYLCLMHMHGEPRTMQVNPRYDDVVFDVLAFLEQRLGAAVAAGIAEELICLDPGIGFGKTPDQNLELVRRLDELLVLGRPLVVGLSRKSTLGRVLGDPDAKQGTLSASLGAAVAAFERGAWMFRVHDVRESVEALAVAAAVERGRVSA
jgi:dihydropteroate synthase